MAQFGDVSLSAERDGTQRHFSGLGTSLPAGQSAQVGCEELGDDGGWPATACHAEQLHLGPVIIMYLGDYL